VESVGQRIRRLRDEAEGLGWLKPTLFLVGVAVLLFLILILVLYLTEGPGTQGQPIPL